jgi:Mor family transcriptional regulator
MSRHQKDRRAWMSEFSTPAADLLLKRSERNVKAAPKDGMLDVIPRLVGADAALRIFEEFGGTTFAFPAAQSAHKAGKKKRNTLIRIVGQEAALTLCRELNGCSVYIPVGHSLLREARNRAIVADSNAGVPVKELVRRYWLTDRSIDRIINEGKNGNRNAP